MATLPEVRISGLKTQTKGFQKLGNRFSPLISSLLALLLVEAVCVPRGARAQEMQSQTAPVIGLQLNPLLERLREIVSRAEVFDARVSARLDDIEGGKTVFAHNSHLLVNPASVTKMFTTATALCLLHPDYRFKTEVYALREPEDGIVRGPLYLKGYGDPFLVNERLHYLALELKALGIKRIDGPIILDDTYFDEKWEGPGWSQDDTSRSYRAPMGALSLNFNTVRVLIFPGEKAGGKARVELMPDSDHLHLANRVTTARRRTRLWLETDGIGRRTRVLTRGMISEHHPGGRYYARIAYPTWYTGHSFKKALRKVGLRTRRTVRRGKVPERAELIYTLRSPALGELVRKVNKRSQNFMAEQLFKTMGAELLGPPGTWYKGQQVMNSFLEEEVGIPASSYVLHNGSGLNDVNRVSASYVVTLLTYMWKRFDVRPDFLASLAVAGADGTVSGRFAHPTVARTMRLKTGGLHNVRALAGYIHSRGNKVYGFAIILTDYSCQGYRMSRFIDRFASAVSRSDRDLLVAEEIEVLPLDDEQQSKLIAPIGPPEGNEEADIPIGEPIEDNLEETPGGD